VLFRRSLLLLSSYLTSLNSLKIVFAIITLINVDSPKDYLIVNVTTTYTKISKYYAKFDNALVYCATIILYSHYRHYLKAL
jgi:hypothetical protein